MFTVSIPVYKFKPEFPLVLKAITKLNQRLVSNISFYIEPTEDCSKIIEEIKRHLPGAKHFVNDRIFGMVENWNQCILKCETPYLIINHDDDYLFPDILNNYYSIFKHCSDIALIGSGYPYDLNNLKIKVRRIIIKYLLKLGLFPSKFVRFYQKGDFEKFLNEVYLLPCSSVAFNISILKKNYLFSKEYKYSTDEELWYRILRDQPIALINDSYVKINRNTNNYEYSTWLEEDFIEQYILIRRDIYQYSGNNEKVKLQLRMKIQESLTLVLAKTYDNDLTCVLTNFDLILSK